MTSTSWLTDVIFNGDDQAWRHDAACAGLDETINFFPTTTQDRDRALAICNGDIGQGVPFPCPVKAECRAYGESLQKPIGIFGGKMFGGARYVKKLESDLAEASPSDR
jgi:hypothetical protein